MWRFYCSCRRSFLNPLMRVRAKTLHPNIADKNNLDKILFSLKFQLLLTLDESQHRDWFRLV